MQTTRIRRGAFTIPAEIRKKAGLKDGTIISVEYKADNGEIIIKPKPFMDEDDYTILSNKGKKMIDEALEDAKNGNVIGPFSDIKEALKAVLQ